MSAQDESVRLRPVKFDGTPDESLIMHEIHLVRELIAKVEQDARERGAQCVTSVRMRYNPLVSFDDDHVQFSFDIAKKESPLLAGAQLVLTRTPGLVRCESCRNEFEIEALPNVCPKCASVNLHPVNATGLALEGFDIE